MSSVAGVATPEGAAAAAASVAVVAEEPHAEVLPAPFDGSAPWRAYGLRGQSHYVILFYQYTAIEDAEAEAHEQNAKCEELGLLGRLLVSTEGLNGSMCGTVAAVEQYVGWMRAREAFVDVDWKGSTSHEQCFGDLHVRVVKEIIATGNAVKPPHEGDAEPEGEELAPEVFHERLSKELASGKPGSEWVLLDCRNENESAVGTFEGALRVPMRNFAEFPKWTADHAEELKGKRVMMFCTGGIRCRKGSAIVNKLGEPADVVQLRGGIHRYLETFPTGGLWRGRNFVFDKRQSLAPPSCDRPLPSEAAADSAEELARADAPSGTAAAAADAAADGTGTAGAAATAAGPASCGEGGVYGRCHKCERPWEEFSGRDVCQVCRFLLLVCPDCRKSERGLFWCHNHTAMEGVYMRYLDDSTPEELTAQRDALDAMHAAIGTGRRLKNKRRTLTRQCTRIDERLAALDDGTATVDPRAPMHPCPTCAELACAGDCWGFWSSKLDCQREKGLLRARDELYVLESKHDE